MATRIEYSNSSNHLDAAAPRRHRRDASMLSKDDTPKESALAVVFDGLRNLALLSVLWIMYSFVRSAAGDDFTAAVANSSIILNLQHALGMPQEAHLQASVLGHLNIVRAANWYYMWAHFPVTGSFLVWAWVRHRPDFPIVRNTLMLATSIGLGLHLLFPLAPPRKLPSFIDTGAVFGPSPYDLGAAEAANQVAAMPSLHVGWALLVALSVIAITKNRFRYLVLIHPAVTAFVVVVTANHYWTDAIVAVVLVIASWMIVWRREQRHNELAAFRREILFVPATFNERSGEGQWSSDVATDVAQNHWKTDAAPDETGRTSDLAHAFGDFERSITSRSTGR